MREYAMRSFLAPEQSRTDQLNEAGGVFAASLPTPSD
jgi:hypothetical protein